MVVFILYFCKFILSVWTFFSVFIAVADAELHCYTNSGIFLGWCAHCRGGMSPEKFRSSPHHHIFSVTQTKTVRVRRNFLRLKWKIRNYFGPFHSFSWNLIIQWAIGINSFFFIFLLIVWGRSFKRPRCGSWCMAGFLNLKSLNCECRVNIFELFSNALIELEIVMKFKA